MTKLKFRSQGLKKALFLFLFTTFIASGCAGRPPLVEQAKAVEAQKYAAKSYAPKYASNFYRKGKLYLKRAHLYFEKRIYAKAKLSYDVARRYFEKSETRARITQIKKGGDF